MSTSTKLNLQSDKMMQYITAFLIFIAAPVSNYTKSNYHRKQSIFEIIL